MDKEGEEICYGQPIQLLHYDSNSWLEGSKICADLDKSSNMLKLNAKGSKFTAFVIEPRYKYHLEGMKVTYGDVVVFRNIKTNLYIHISDREVMEPIDDVQKLHDSARKYRHRLVIPADLDKRSPPSEFAPGFEVNIN